MDSATKADPAIMHGTPCFSGTRVAAQTLFDCVEEGHSIDYFLEEFPSVKREQVLSVLDSASRHVLADAVAER